jgi:hypothetical protein
MKYQGHLKTKGTLRVRGLALKGIHPLRSHETAELGRSKAAIWHSPSPISSWAFVFTTQKSPGKSPVCAHTPLLGWTLAGETLPIP